MVLKSHILTHSKMPHETLNLSLIGVLMFGIYLKTPNTSLLLGSVRGNVFFSGLTRQI